MVEKEGRARLHSHGQSACQLRLLPYGQMDAGKAGHDGSVGAGCDCGSDRAHERQLRHLLVGDGAGFAACGDGNHWEGASLWPRIPWALHPALAQAVPRVTLLTSITP